MKRKLNDKQKLLAYVLSTDSDLNTNKRVTQKEIGDLLGVSQATIAQGIKDVRHMREVSDLNEKLLDAKRQIIAIKEKGEWDEVELNDDYSDEYKRLP